MGAAERGFSIVRRNATGSFDRCRVRATLAMLNGDMVQALDNASHKAANAKTQQCCMKCSIHVDDITEPLPQNLQYYTVEDIRAIFRRLQAAHDNPRNQVRSVNKALDELEKATGYLWEYVLLVTQCELLKKNN